ncbi:hypothetical protein DFH05DRAFT_1471121 [Lentinula detonsa]|uniref:Uncharacterized protein n=1 Tax=Lentinula detonsa TaxID=2804962 RepID=A0A9W8PCI5_9AGAR|nr:hypothetical protein DFH05DRAFT_1471121 [Lentinula detonsa]
MHHPAVAIPPEKVALATKEARKEGIFAGLTSALASTLIGSKALGLKRYPALACGASKFWDSFILISSIFVAYYGFTVTAVLSGYYFTEVSLGI